MTTPTLDRTQDDITFENIIERNFYLPIPEPVHLGPTWERNAFGQFALPEITLGWQVIAWIQGIPGRKNARFNLVSDEGTAFSLTAEQKRFLLWWYAIDEKGIFAFREGVLQRVKGWG